jgi:hypothetical protein
LLLNFLAISAHLTPVLCRAFINYCDLEMFWLWCMLISQFCFG